MSDLEPITRAENFWVNEGDLEPITRKEQYIKHLYDETQVVPEYPKTREEYFINKAGEELHDVTVEQLNVTENGTYTAPSGKAYSPVSVNVPLPSNAYLLQTIEHESIATFSDGTDNFLKSLEVSIEPQQDLHGYDNPWVGGSGKNKFDIATISAKMYIGENGSLFGSNNWSASDFITVNSGTAYVLSGITNSGSLAKHAFYDGDKVFISAINSTEMNFTTPSNAKYVRISMQSETPTNVQLEQGSTATSFAPYSNICPIIGWDECNVTVADATADPTVSNVYTISLNGTRYGGKLDVVNGELVVTDGYISSYNGETLPSTWISDRDVYAEGTTPTTGAEVCYKLATPQTIQLTPTIVKSLQGDNNFFASTGEIELLQYWGKEVS